VGSSKDRCYLPEVGEASGCAGRFFQQDRAESNARERERRDSNTQTHTHTQRKRATERVVEREAPHGEKAPSASSASCCCSRLTARVSEQHTHWNQWRITEEALRRQPLLLASPLCRATVQPSGPATFLNHSSTRDTCPALVFRPITAVAVHSQAYIRGTCP